MNGLPAPAPPRHVAFPAIRERYLPSGMRVASVDWGNGSSPLRVPLVASRLIFRRGAGDDPADRSGAASLAATVAPLGAAGRSAPVLARTVDALGARLDCSAGYDSSTAAAGASSATFPEALMLLNDIVRLPEFLPDEIDRARVRAESDLRLAMGSPSSLARIVLARAAFGDGRYARPLGGTLRSLARIARPDLVAYANATYRPDDTTLILAGALGTDEAFALAERIFGDWHATVPAAVIADSPETVIRGRAVVIDRPDAGRTSVVLGVGAPARSSLEYDAGVVATAILSGYSGRLNTRIRVERGLSYGAGAQYVARRDAGTVIASTLVEHARVIETVDVIRATFAELAVETVANRELERRKTSILGGYYRSIETADGIASQLSELAAYDVPFDDLAAFPERIEAIDPEHVRAFAAAHLAAEPYAVIVGDAKAFAGELAARFATVEVVGVDELDLDSPSLRLLSSPLAQ